MHAPIGVFDSGFGGLDIFRHIVEVLPGYDYMYLGDTARAPYGTRTQETVCEFTREAVDFLFRKNCGLIILACNTASSEALHEIQQEYLPAAHPDKRVLGVLIPAAEHAVELTRNKRIGVIATPATVESASFVREIHKIDGSVQVFQESCPLLVPLVEAGEHDSEATEMILRNYLAPLMKKDIDTLILGCTHYGFLEEKAKRILGPNVCVLSEGKVVAKKLARYLARHPETENKLTKNRVRAFYSTDLTDTFTTLGSTFFGAKIDAQRAVLTKN